MKKLLWRMAWIAPVLVVYVVLNNTYHISLWAGLALAAINVIGWIEGKTEGDVL